jgi:hypothetical protein
MPGGMNSERLSAREKAPGHDRTFEASEKNFIEVARKCLDPDLYDLDAKPKVLRDLFPGLKEGVRALGIVPEAVITSRRTGRSLFVEVKKQAKKGNAEERACKHHTVQFYKCLQERFGYSYHPIVTIFCESLAVLPRYTRKAEYYFEPDQYCNWVDYDPEILCEYLRARCTAWLEP